MAKQKGIIKLKGTLGDITFYKTQDGFLARERGGLDASRIATDPNFQRTRENGEEFGAAGKAGKMLRASLRALLQNTSDSRMVGRLTREMMKVIQADLTSVRGKRNVIDGEAELLEGFEFNIRSKLGSTLYAPFSAAIDRVAGTLTVDIPSFIPINMVAAPGGSTHFKIISAGVSVDFENESFEVDTNESEQIAWNSVATGAISLANTIAANNTNPLFLALGIEFYQDVNGVSYALKNGSYNALALVKVNGV
ncbi:MAG: hypothetical protein H7Y86_04360 [Rhizobacter sp.]|nr:hypothetical protein [Ferruginibacter sp.]